MRARLSACAREIAARRYQTSGTRRLLRHLGLLMGGLLAHSVDASLVALLAHLRACVRARSGHAIAAWPPCTTYGYAFHVWLPQRASSVSLAALLHAVVHCGPRIWHMRFPYASRERGGRYCVAPAAVEALGSVLAAAPRSDVQARHARV